MANDFKPVCRASRIDAPEREGPGPRVSSSMAQVRSYLRESIDLDSHRLGSSLCRGLFQLRTSRKGQQEHNSQQRSVSVRQNADGFRSLSRTCCPTFQFVGRPRHELRRGFLSRNLTNEGNALCNRPNARSPKHPLFRRCCFSSEYTKVLLSPKRPRQQLIFRASFLQSRPST